jgi:hypothetical protein
MKREVRRSILALACAGPLLVGTSAGLAAQEPEPHEAKSPGTARLYSLLGTGVPLAGAYAVDKMGWEDPRGIRTIGGLVLGGVILGPVLGYTYSGETKRGMIRAGIRAAVVAGTAGAVFAICEAGNCDVLNSAGPELALAGIVALGGGVYTAILIWRDIEDVDDRARARNQRLGAVSVRPTYFPESRAPGLVFTWRH